MDQVQAYCEQVRDRQIVTGRPVQWACSRHLTDLAHGADRGLVWYGELASNAITFFRKILRLEDGRPFVLEPFQEFIVGSLFGWYRFDGYRRFRTAYIELAKGNGKALSLATPIATPTGWTTMQYVAAGDWVFDERGQPTQVIFATAPMEGHTCYRVRFSDGHTIIADAEHLWQVRALRTGGKKGLRKTARPQKGKPGLLTTAEIACTLLMKDSPSKHPQAKYNYRVDVAGPLQLPDVALPVPPYTLGCWLGDGDSDCARLTCADSEILEGIEREGIIVGERKPQKENKSFRVRLGARNNSLQAILRAMGLLNNKHIPPLYFRASYQQRLALLQGLLDTDGTIHIDQGRIEFSVCNERLAWDFVELATTLGFKPMLTEGDAKIQGRTVGKRYRVGMTAYNDMLVFQLPRKSARLKARPRTASLSSGRMIVACEPVASEPVKCIKVANPSGLFLAGKGMIPTHNTPVGGGIGLYGFLADNEPSAEIYSAATGREQASICFKDAKRMVEASPALQKRVDINVGNLAVLGTNSYFRPVSSEHKGLDGKRVHMAIIDELHEHPDSIVVDKMRAGTKRRQNALIFEITNSGFDRNTVCWQHHDLSLKILQGIIENDAWFAYVATLDPCEACAAEGRTDPNPECQHCDDWRDESTWLKANPGLDTILPRQYLREQVAEAIAMPSKENIVRRLNFCIWTKSKTRWLSMTKWDECNRGPITLDSLRGRPCYAGLDLASTIDIAALVLLFPPISEDEDWYTVLPYFFVPEEHPRAKSDKEIFTYIQWIKQGSMIATEGDVIDYDAIRACIAGPQVLQSFAPGAVETYTGSLKKWRIPEEGLASWFDIKAVVKDRWGSVGIGTQLQGDGLTVVDYGQGFASMTAPARALEGIVQERRLHHGGHPVLRWMASNTMVRTDPAGNIKPDKGKSTEKIDGIVALLMALGVSDKTPLEEPPIYETRGAISIKLPRTRYD